MLRTPLVPVEGALLKLECLQPTGSFKVRGFFAAALGAAEGAAGAAGSSPSAPATPPRPARTSPRARRAVPRGHVRHRAPTKIDGVKRWGATPILMPRDEVLDWMATQGWKSEPETFIHPFADPRR